MRKDLYSMKMLMRWLPLWLFVCISLQMPSHAQAPIILSTEGAPLIFELPLDASTVQSLSANTTIRLATPAQHAAQGMNYPQWLSDASFSVKNRPQQRLTIVVAPKRGNPELSTELLMTLNNSGRRSFKPLHLMFDTVSRFVGMPLPTVAAVSTSQEEKPDLSVLLTPVIRFESVAETTPVPEQPHLSSSRGLPTQPMPTTDKPKANTSIPKPKDKTATANSKVIAPQVIIATLASAPVASPAPAVSSLTQTVAPKMPVRITKPLPPPASGLDDWLAQWPMLAGGLVVALALLYLLTQAFRRWRGRKANQLPTTFLDPRPTALSPEESGANTVFGVSEEDANAMHAKWLREQATNRF
jgi:hypothetical protein